MNQHSTPTRASGSDTSRGYHRAHARASVDLCVDVLADGFLHRCRVVDLSTNGMLVVLTPSLKDRNPHFVESYRLHLGTMSIPITARTIWRDGARQGVRFVRILESERCAIQESVNGARHSGPTDVDRLESAERCDAQDASREVELHERITRPYLEGD